jgi:hypothetical protein
MLILVPMLSPTIHHGGLCTRRGYERLTNLATLDCAFPIGYNITTPDK